MFLLQDERRYADPSYEPLLLVRWIVRRPIIVAAVSLSIALILAAVCLTQPIKIDKRTESFRVRGDATVRNYDAFLTARLESTRLRSHIIEVGEDPSNSRRFVDASPLSSPQERRQTIGYVAFVYEAESGEKNLLTETPLTRIRQLEQQLLTNQDYASFCKIITKKSRTTRDGEVALLSSDWKDVCEPPLSVMNYFYPTRNSSEVRKYRLYDVYDFDGKGELYGINDVKALFAYADDKFSWFLDRNFSVWRQKSQVLRSVFSFGGPLPGFNSTEGIELELQRDILFKWLMPLAKQWKDSSDQHIRVMYHGTRVTEAEVDDVIKFDVLFAIVSLVVVGAWMWVHVRSIVLTAAGMLHILLSIPAGYFFIRIVLQDQFLGILMCMAIFVILGIGCDDVFIFYDAWVQSAVQNKNILHSLETRLDWVFRRAVGTMFVTSFTTAAAFLANSFSALVPIRMFGIFMAVIVILNFLLVITWFPAVLIMWHRACVKSDSSESTDAELAPNNSVLSSQSSPRVKALTGSSAEISLDAIGDNVLAEPAGTEPGNPFPEPSKLRATDRFFFSHFVPAIDGMNQLIVGLGLMLFIAFAIMALFLKPHPGEPQFFPSGHQLARMARLEQTVFPLESGSYESVSVIWGIEGIDRDNADPYNPDDLGEVEWNSSFNLAEPESQQHLFDSFYAILDAQDSRNRSIVMRDQKLQDLHRCFICAFKDWRIGRNLSFPVESPDDFWTSLKQYLQEDGSRFQADLGWSDDGEPSEQKIRFVSFNFRSTLNSAEASSYEKDLALKAWNSLLERINLASPATARGAFATSKLFMWHITETNLMSTALFGTIVSLATAFIIMTLFTANIIVSLMALGSIISVVAALAAFMVIAGWSIGIIESVAFTIIVGLSVDYTVHVGVSYIHYSRHWFLADRDRREIVQYAMAEIGSSVLGGAVTTAFSVLSLFFCTITFFRTFGQFVFVNCLLSLASSFTLFVSLLLLWGAQYRMTQPFALIADNCAGPRGFQGTIKLLLPKHAIQGF